MSLKSLSAIAIGALMAISNVPPPGSFGPALVQAIALSSLSRHGATVDQEPDCVEISGPPYDREYVCGDIYEVSVRQPTSDPDLLAITTTLGICSGHDTSLYVIRRQGSAWSLLLAQESNDYEDVSGALASYVAEPDADGQFFVVTANVNPWCTSN